MQLLCFLRTFNGHGDRSCSYARFPYNQLDIVLQYIKTHPDYHLTEHIGRHELDGHICIEYRGMWCCIRRKNGEDHWNVCLVRSHVFPDFNVEAMLTLFEVLRAAGVTLHIPTEPYQYIEPISTDKQYYEEVHGWCRTDSTTITEAQEIETVWNNERNQVAQN